MANNLPSNLKRHTMFRDKPYSHKVNFPEGYTMPTLITAEVRKNNRVIIGITPTITKEGQSFTFTYSPETLSKIMGLYDQYYLFDGIQVLGGEINTVIQIGDPDGGETNVTIAGESVTTIQIPGSQLAFETLEQVTTLAEQVDTDTIAVEAGRAATEGYLNQVVNLKSDVTTLKSDMIAIRDEAMSIVANPRPATYAAMVALLRLNHPKTFTVQNDEFQGIQKVPYYWDGVELYVYGTLVDPQPTVTQ